MISLGAQAEGPVFQSGGREMSQPQGKVEPQWKAIGIAYVLEKDGVVEVRLLFESHVSAKVREELAERFGVGAVPWQVAGETGGGR